MTGVTLIAWPALSAALGGVSKPSVARWERAGRFPRRVKIGPNRVAWIRQEIDDWILTMRKQEAVG